MTAAAKVSQPRDLKLIVEKDVRIPLRDGSVLYADVFRPDTSKRVPAIVNLSVYQKDKLWVPPADLEEAANPYMMWNYMRNDLDSEYWRAAGQARNPHRRQSRTLRFSLRERMAARAHPMDEDVSEGGARSVERRACG